MKYFLICLMALTLLTNCKKDDDGFICLDKTDADYVDSDDDGTGDDCDLRDDRSPQSVIEEIISRNNWNTTVTDNGLHYLITEEGPGDEFPTINSTVQMHYHGTLENGTIFDSTQGRDPLISPLSGLIAGWQVGVPFFKKGSEGILIVPPSLGYGQFGSGLVPGNGVMIFEIELVAFD